MANKSMRFFIISVLLLTVALAGCNNQKIESNISSQVAPFQFTNQNNEPFASEQLDNQWWIAYFFYTNCKLVCPHTTANMVNVQQTLDADGYQPPIIAFSVDPDFDTPEVLTEYAATYDANLHNMTFLTGYDFPTIKKLSNESFKTMLDGGGPDDHAYAHSTYFFLVNPDGEVVKRYDGMIMDDLQYLIEDIKKVM